MGLPRVRSCDIVQESFHNMSPSVHVGTFVKPGDSETGKAQHRRSNMRDLGWAALLF